LNSSGVHTGRAEKHYQNVFSVRLRELFDSTLNLKVHCAGSGSNKALSRRVDDLGAEPGNRLLDGVGRHAVTLAQYHEFFSTDVHQFSFTAVLSVT
jgi:hypothetical protein